MLMAEGGQDGAGHRARLRQRLLDGGADALLDHEIVEYLLALSIPRRDTKKLANRLIERFGGVGQLLSADAQAIRKEAGLGDPTIAAFKIVQAAALRLAETKLAKEILLGSSQTVIDYLRTDMAWLSVEQVRILYLDARNRLIAAEASRGSVDESAVYVREILRRAMDLGATALIIAHNHPSGDPTPSRQDIKLTRDLAEAARPLRITLHDHLVVGAEGHSSLRELGLF